MSFVTKNIFEAGDNVSSSPKTVFFGTEKMRSTPEMMFPAAPNIFSASSNILSAASKILCVESRIFSVPSNIFSAGSNMFPVTKKLVLSTKSIFGAAEMMVCGVAFMARLWGTPAST